MRCAVVRTKNEEAIIHLVSTWPLQVLDLNAIDLPLEGYLPPPEGGPCVADFMIKGLLYRKRKSCDLQVLVLPKDTAVGKTIYQKSKF